VEKKAVILLLFVIFQYSNIQVRAWSTVIREPDQERITS